MKTLLTTLNSKFIHSSLSIRYLKSFCKEITDIFIEEFTINNDLDYVMGEIFKGGYDLVCFSCYIWNIEETLYIAENLKKVSKNIKILLGGPEVSYDPGNLLQKYDFIDFIVYGEGELTFKELLKALVHKEVSLRDIEGLAYREGRNIFINRERELIKDLDTIPFPYEDLKELDNRIIYYESSRGCPFNCQYCLSSTIKGVRYFSMERIKNDLKYFVDSGVKQVKFVDRTFNANKKHALEIMKYLKEIDNGHINFHFEITARLMDDEMLEFLSGVRKGLFQFEIGVQSTNEETLRSIDRNEDFEYLSFISKRLLEYGNIHLHLDLIAGLPYEDYKRFLKSFDDVYMLYPDKIQLGFLKLLKGSGIRRDEEKHGYIYKRTPPYEVLENNYISYFEILRLKSIENILEIYYNSHNFDFSLKYIIEHNFSRPSEFYEGFAEFWEKNKFYANAHKKEEYYKILLDFCIEIGIKEIDIILELMKFDYVRNFRGNLPEIFEYVEIDNFKDRCHKFLQKEENIKIYLPEFLGQPAKMIIKHIRFEIFKYDILEVFKNEKNTKRGKYVYLFNYNRKNGEKPSYQKISL